MIKKIVAFSCALVMMLLCFASCNNKKKQNGADEERDGVILTSDLASYTIVYGRNYGVNVAKKANVLAAKLNALYGVTVNVGPDDKFRAGEKEILVGYTNRAESISFLSDLRSEDYGYAMVGGKLCIGGATDECTGKAVDAFMQTVLAQAVEKWELGTPNLTRAEYAVGDLRINGESIKGWSVVYTSENQNSEKQIAELIRGKIAEISGFVPFLCTDRDNITDKVIHVHVAEGDPKVLVSGNRISVCGKDAEELAQAAATLLGRLSNATLNGNVLDVTVEDNSPLDRRIAVMSFNVRYDLTENAGLARVDAAVAQIRDLSPDVFGIQEDSKQWCTLLDQKLTEYTAVRSVLQAGQDEYLTIYYKTDTFTKVSSGLLWLSDTPTVPNSKFSESSITRGMNYAVLERKSDGAKFCFVNTHLEHTASADVAEKRMVARQKQTQVLLEQTAKIVGQNGNIPSVMVGDFNSTNKELLHSVIRESGYADCRTDAIRITAQGTWNTGYYGGAVDKNSDVLDYCYASKNGFVICSYKVSADQYHNMYTSDHFPVVVELLLLQ